MSLELLLKFCEIPPPVRKVIHEMDFIKTRDEDETANLIWNDSAVQHEKIAELRNYQVCRMATMFTQHNIYAKRLKKRAWKYGCQILLLHSGNVKLKLQ